MARYIANGIRVFCGTLLWMGSLWASGETVTPLNPTVVTSQSQGFTASPTPVSWALAAGSAGALSAAGVYTAPALIPTPPVAATCGIFPNNNVWNVRVDQLPVDPNSAAYIQSIGAAATLHPDFTMPYTDVPGTQPKVPVTFTYASESDPGPYPIPPNAPIEGGSNSTGDRHVIVIDHDNCVLYELFNAWPQSDGSWKAGGGAIFDLKSNALRPAGWTSADAAGLPILPGLVKYDEVAAGVIRHAIRFTAPATRSAYVWPARHYAGTANGTQYPPMGQRFRLKASFNISGYSPHVQVILRAMQQYGLILADNGGPWMFQGAADPRWDMNDMLGIMQVLGSNLEAVSEGSLNIDPNTAQTPVNTATVVATSTSNLAATGQSRVTLITPGNHVVGVTVAPAEVTLGPGATQQFTAAVTGSANTAVVWSVSGGLGSISASGLYSPPAGAAGQSVKITVTSVADSTKSASATVYLAASTSASASVTFVHADGSTLGSWRGVYGADGFNVVQDAAQYPAYASVKPTGEASYTWAASTTDVRALEMAPPATGRIAATWYGAAFSVDINLTDGKTHPVSLYFLDWEKEGRDETLQIVDTLGNLLDSRNVSDFLDGRYLTWNLSGHVVIRLTCISGYNAVLSGIFFGGGQPASGAAAFVKRDTTTVGNWMGVYGGDGYNVLGDLAAYPAYAAVTPSGESSYTWASSTTDPRALEKASVAGERVAATWFTSTSMSIDLNLTDGNTHQVALYCLDWNYKGRSQTVTVTDAQGNTLDAQSLSSFTGGVYLVWNLSGHVQIHVTATGGPNAVVSGLFFGGGGSAAFVKIDSATQGNWKGVYGGAGYNVINNATAYPSDVSVLPAGESSYTWAAATSDPRALEMASGSGRIAATWFTGSSMTVDLSFSDGHTHQLAVYCLDWNYRGRSETLALTDSSGKTLDTRSIANFTGGQYLVWNVSGHVRLKVTTATGPNAVISGVFFQ